MNDRKKGIREVTLYPVDKTNEWRFKPSSYKFSDIELVSTTATLLDVSMGLNGIGFPEAEYMVVARQLFALNDEIICHSSVGSWCQTELSCGQLLPLIEDDATFKIEFSENS